MTVGGPRLGKGCRDIIGDAIPQWDLAVSRAGVLRAVGASQLVTP